MTKPQQKNRPIELELHIEPKYLRTAESFTHATLFEINDQMIYQYMLLNR